MNVTYVNWVTNWTNETINTSNLIWKVCASPEQIQALYSKVELFFLGGLLFGITIGVFVGLIFSLTSRKR